MPILVENMPGACGPRLPQSVDHCNVARVNTIDAHAQSLVSSICVDDSNDHKF